MGNKQQFTAELRINAIVTEAQKELNKFGDGLSKVWQGGEPPKNILKTFEAMKTRLASLQELSKKGIVNSAELQQAEADYKAFQKDIHNLTVEFKLFSTEQKKAMLSKEEQNAMQARAKAVDEYTAALRRNREAQEKRGPLEAKRAAAVTRKAQATTNVEGLEKRKSNLGTGPALAGKALQYAANTKTLEGLQTQIRDENKRAQGLVDEKAIQRSKDRVAGLEKQIKALDVTTGKAEFDEAWQKYNESIAQVGRELDAAEKELKDANNEIRTIDKTLEGLKVTTTAEEFNKLKTALKAAGVEGADAATDIEQLKDMVRKLDNEALKRVDDNLAAAAAQVQNLGNQALEAKGGLDEATDSIKRQNDALADQQAFENRIKQFIGLQGAAIVMRRALQDAMQTIKELDATMTEMAVVTDLGVSDYWDQLPEYTARANDLGMAINDVYKADTLFYQQGLKTNEVVELSTQTIKMARVAGLDTAEATDRMTAALRGFNMELNEANATNIADVYSKLAAITASDVDEISSAMTKTASIASSAGMEFETTAAFLSQIIETTRESAETAGTAMKTVIARFQELKKDPAEIGEVDGEIVDANKIETALRSVGVALRDSSGQFRELDDVFLELSSKWDGLDKNTQRYIATIAAGSRQQSRFLAMMSDYARTQELVAAANNAAGASNEQFEKTMESIDAKLNELKNAWDEFTMSIMNSELVKFGVDMLTTFLKVVNKATSGLEGIAGSLTKIISVVAVFKLASKLFKKVETPLFNLYNKIVKESYGYGFKATQEYKRGADDAAAGKEAEAKKPEEKTPDKQTFTEKFKDVTGSTKRGAVKRRNEAIKIVEEYKNKGFDLEEKKAYAAKKKAYGWKKDGTTESKRNGADKAREEYQKAIKEIENYEKAEKEAAISSEAAWKEVGEGVSQTGTAIAGLGIGLSIVGGILSELGLEEVGEGFAKMGNVVTLLGTGISFLGGIVPTVANLMAAAGIKVQTAWWPLLVIGLAIAAIVGIIAGIVAAVEKANAAKLENRMKAAAEATKEAKETAQEAKEAYQGLLDTWDRYKDTQNSLEDLTVGTTEWKEALHEANLEVLDLISEYPELQKWVHRTNEGQLKIAEEGWKELEEKRLEMMNNTNIGVMGTTMDDIALKFEAQKQEGLENISSIDFRQSHGGVSSGGTRQHYNDSLEQAYELAGASRQSYTVSYTTGQWGDTADKLSQEVYSVWFEALKDGTITAEALKANVSNTNTQDAFGKSQSEMIAIVDSISAILLETEKFQDERAAVAETYLSQIASNTVKNSDQYDNIVSFYGNYAASEENQQKIIEKASSVGKDYHDNLADNDFYGQLLKDYEVSDAGNNMEKMKALYKKMTGKSDEDLEGKTYEELAKAVAEIGVNNELADNMTDLAQTLAGITNKTARNQIGALLGGSGAGLTKEMVNELFTDGLQGAINQEAVEKYFANAGLSLEEMAKTAGVSAEALIKQIETNTRKSYQVQVNAMNRLNVAREKHLGEEFKEQEKFSNLSISQAAAIANKLTDILATSGTDLSDEFENVVGQLGDKADMFTSYISSINWSDANAKEKIQSELEGMGIEWTAAIEDFVDAAFEAGHSISIIDFETLNEGLKDTYDLLQALKSGGQSREFEEEQYKKLIEADGSLTKEFVQIGDKFVYVGTSMDKLINALDKNTDSVIEQSKYQYQQQSAMATMLSTGEAISVGGVGYDVKSTVSGDLERDQQVVYLQAIRDQLLEEVRKGSLNADALSFITGTDGNGLGLSFTTDFSVLSDEMLAAAVDGFQKLASQSGDYLTKYAEAQRESRILGYAQNSAEENAAKAARLGYQSTEGKEYVEALIAQAAQSGGVAEAVIEKYAEAVEANNAAEITKYEQKIIRGINDMVKNQEQLQQLVELQNQVEEMLYNERQKEIDKLSTINDSINEANSQLLSKMQEQIDDARQARDNEKAEQNIADLEAQRAYLAASGGSSVELAALDKQIAESKESYQDSLVDQAMADLQDANEKAAAQRERQISIAEEQLQFDKDSGKLSREAETIVKESLTAINNGKNPINTSIGQLFAKEGEWYKLTDGQRALEESGFKALITNAANIANALGAKGSKLDDKGNETEVEPPKTGADVAGGLQSEINDTNAKNETSRQQAIEQARDAALATTGGWDAVKTSTGYQNALSTYTSAGGLASEFESEVQTALKESDTKMVVLGPKGTYDHYELFGGQDNYAGHHKGLVYDGDVWYSYKNEDIDGSVKTKLWDKFPNAEDQQIVLYGEVPYIKTKEGWRQIQMGAKALASRLRPFKTGGLADFTGPAWLDGTKARPELVLNQRDTQNFIALKDILSDVMKNNVGSGKSNSSGDNYFDIEINVESLENDYDVEQIADKIRDMIYSDATRRNVNAVNQKK